MIKKKFSDALQFVKERYVAKKIRKIVGSGEQGFTLLEILVVLTIMGFLIAMVAPRLAGISGDAVDTVCDSNQNRMVGYLGAYFEKTNRFPDKLTNIVVENATGYQIPSISDDNPENGAETLAKEFNDRNRFALHILNDKEAAELKKMGINNLFNLNSYSNDLPAIAATDQKAFMKPQLVAGGVGVAMVGFGAIAAADAATFAVSPTLVSAGNDLGWGEPDWFGRIVLGMGPESGLVKSGIISNAAHCPGGLQNTDNATYNDYNIVLPRLASTVERANYGVLGSVIPAATAGVTPKEINVTAYAYDDDNSIADGDATADLTTYKTRTFNIAEVQSMHEYHTQCPEGHMYPEDEAYWAIDLNTAATINGAPTTP